MQKQNHLIYPRFQGTGHKRILIRLLARLIVATLRYRRTILPRKSPTDIYFQTFIKSQNDSEISYERTTQLSSQIQAHTEPLLRAKMIIVSKGIRSQIIRLVFVE